MAVPTAISLASLVSVPLPAPPGPVLLGTVLGHGIGVWCGGGGGGGGGVLSKTHEQPHQSCTRRSCIMCLHIRAARGGLALCASTSELHAEVLHYVPPHQSCTRGIGANRLWRIAGQTALMQTQ